MSTVRHSSLIAKNRSLVRTHPVPVPWQAISIGLFAAAFGLACVLARLRQIQDAATVAISQPTPENRIAARSYHGPISDFIGGGLFDVVETIGAEFEASQNSARQSRAALQHFTGLAVHLLSQNPRAIEQLATQARTHGLMDGSELLKRIDTKRAAFPAPVEIPTIAKLKLLRVTTGPVGSLQFDLVAQSNERIDGLTLADIAVKDIDGNEWPLIALEQIVSPLADHSIVVLVDKSSSMAGDRIVKLQGSLEVFIVNCASSTRLAIVGFDSKVTPLTTLTNDHRVLTDAVKSIVADGNTEITKALDYAKKVLSGTPGFRNILLCTDGVDPELAKNLQRIVADCEQARISVNVLALEDATLDKSNLTLLAQQTRGQLCLADNPLSINQQMQRMIAFYSQPSYRLFVFNPARKLDRYRMFLVNRPELFIDVQP